MKNIVELTKIIKHPIPVEQLYGLFPCQSLIKFIAFNTKDRKLHLFAHRFTALHIGKQQFSGCLFSDKQGIQHICAVLP